MRSRTAHVLVVVCLMATTAAAQSFTKNQGFKLGVSPATIPRDYQIGSATGTIPVGAAVHIVYGIEVPAGDPNPVTITATEPPSFVTTQKRCVKFPGGSTIGSPIPCTTSSFSVGPLSAADDQVVVVFDGYFKSAGTATATFSASRGSVTEPTSLNMDANITTLPVDLDVKKLVKPKLSGTFGSTATVAFGDTVTYQVTLKNASTPDPNHTTDLYIGPLLKLFDKVSAPSTNDVNVTFAVTSFTCSATGTAVCPSPMPPGSSPTLNAGSSTTLATFTYPTSSTGLIPAGDSIVITFDANLTTTAQCSPGQNNKIINTADFTYSTSTATISDTNALNNSSSTTVTLTGLPVTGCPTGGGSTLSVSVTKTLLSPAAWGPSTMRYRIEVKNTTGQTLTGLKLTDYVYGSGTPPFTATVVGNVTCTPACTNVQVLSPPWVTGSGSAHHFFTADFAPLANNATQVVEHYARYDSPCSNDGKGGTITNWAIVGGPASGNHPVDAAMPALPKCDLVVRKIRKTGTPATFSSYPVTLGYTVSFTNNSPTQIVKVGTLADVMALDNPAYANFIDVAYTYSCTATNVTMPTSWNATGSNNAQIKFNTPVTNGVKIFDAQGGVTFAPSGTLSCDVSVTLKQPPGDDSKCPSVTPGNAVNVGILDLQPNQYANPKYQAPVPTPLAKCISLVVGKTATDATPGSTATFTLTVKNAGNDPVSNVTLTDNVPAIFTNVTWTCATGCATPSGAGNAISIPLSPINSGATVTITVTATAPTVLGTYCNEDKAIITPFPADTFFEGDPAFLLKASACVQVKNPTATGKPKLAKAFDPGTIGPGGSASLTFTITNTTGDPAQSGIAFTDKLPAGLAFDAVLTNTCGGTASISLDKKTFTYTGGTLAAGMHTCKIVVRMKATGTCGKFGNDKSNFSAVSNLDVADANAQLQVVECTGGLIVRKEVTGAPAGYSGQFPFLVQCVTPSGLYQKEVTVSWPTPGFVALTDIPAGSQCTVTEGALPATPTGSNWDGLPVYTPDGGAIVTTDKGGEVKVRNAMKPCNETGQVRITKIVEGVPAGFKGTFTGTLQCFIAGKLVTYPVTLTSPGGLVTTVDNIPLGSTCTFQETSQAPLPSPLQWNPPVYSPKFGTVTLSGLCCQDVTVTNTARECCEKPKEPYGKEK